MSEKRLKREILKKYIQYYGAKSPTYNTINNFRQPIIRRLCKAAFWTKKIISMYIRDDGSCRKLIHSQWRREAFAWLPQFEVVITTRCSLRCKYCSNLMQYYNEPYDVPVDIIKDSFIRLMSICDHVGDVIPIGGEPFLCRNFSELLKFFLGFSKIDRVVIFTNGTIAIRDEELLILLADPRVTLKISDYGFGNVKEFCKKMDEHNVNYTLFTEDRTWRDDGDLKPRFRNNEELKQQFNRCASPCRSLLNGQLHFCPRSGHGTDLGLIPLQPNDYLDFMDARQPVSKMQLLEFYFRTQPITACDYCDSGTYEQRKVYKAGSEQLSKPYNLNNPTEA